MSKNSYEGCLGPRVSFQGSMPLFADFLELNMMKANSGDVRFALCAWGPKGIGKTTFVRSFANVPVTYNGITYPGWEIHEVSPAQFEETGDFTGFPQELFRMLRENEEKWVAKEVIKQYEGEGWVLDTSAKPIMGYAAPSWVPTEDKPSILLFDDWNRAPNRVVKGLMQIFQNYGGIGWKLPNSCSIVLTGNPDNGENLVTTIDEAICTRIKHVTIEPSPKEWVGWATEKGLNQAGISYFKEYPETIIGGERTCPRTWAEFCEHLNLAESHGEPLTGLHVSRLGEMLLDPETVKGFQGWVEKQYAFTLEPSVVLEEPAKAKAEVDKMSKEGRLDVINLSLERLLREIYERSVTDEAAPAKKMKEWIANFQAFVLGDAIPKDAKIAFLKPILEFPGLTAKAQNRLKKWIQGSPELHKVICELLHLSLGV